ncbi:MAG: hypothetical protein RSD67_02100 [Oscillospiraceae bacterium]
MLRGVNKSIIEVLETENKYFEKAILFIRADVKSTENSVLGEKANEYLNSVSITPKEKFSGKYFAIPMWAKLASSCAVGAIIASILGFLI